MRSDVGEPVTAESFRVLRIKPVGQYQTCRFQHWNGDGPVPGTGKNGSVHYFRNNIRYINAKRATQHISEEGEVAPRAARATNALPDAWDDLTISSRRYRSWKQFRKTQWR